MSRAKKNYRAITETWLQVNGLEMARYKDYLGVQRLKIVPKRF